VRCRWVIRCAVSLLIAIFIGTWIRSYFDASAIYFQNGDDSLGVGVSEGTVFMGWMNGRAGHDGLNLYNLKILKAYSIRSLPGVHYFRGFFTRIYCGSYRLLVFLGMPLWFVTGVLVLAMAYVWRTAHRTKPPWASRQTPGRTFARGV
jgi:hypothetical protein